MHLRKQKRPNGRVYLSIVQSYRTPEGKTRSKTIRSLGYLDDLSKQYEDPIAHFQAEIDQENRQRKDSLEPIGVSFAPRAKIPLGCARQIEAGSIVCSEVLHRRLGLSRFFGQDDISRACPPQTCAVLELLVWSRLAHPQVFDGAWKSRAMFPAGAIPDQEDLYRCIKHLGGLDRAIVTWVDGALPPSRRIDRELASYCLVSNYYVEATRYQETSRAHDWEKDPSPLIQAAVLVSKSGIPFDFEIFDGALDDQLSSLPAARTLCERHSDIPIVVVANKGIGPNSPDLTQWPRRSRGYLFSQSLRKSARETREWVLDRTSYHSQEAENLVIKERVVNRKIDASSRTQAKQSDAVALKEVAFWQRGSYERSRFERYRIVGKNEAVYAHGFASGGPGSPLHAIHGWGDARSGDLSNRLWQVYWNRIASDEALDGYHMLVSSELDSSGRELVDIYHNLHLMHSFFRLPPGEWSTCPAFIDRKSYIQAHFLICYVAAIVSQLLYAETGKRFPNESVLETLANLTGREIEANSFFFDYRTALSDALCSRSGIDLSHPLITQARIQEMAKSVRT